MIHTIGDIHSIVVDQDQDSHIVGLMVYPEDVVRLTVILTVVTNHHMDVKAVGRDTSELIIMRLVIMLGVMELIIQVVTVATGEGVEDIMGVGMAMVDTVLVTVVMVEDMVVVTADVANFLHKISFTSYSKDT